MPDLNVDVQSSLGMNEVFGGYNPLSTLGITKSEDILTTDVVEIAHTLVINKATVIALNESKTMALVNRFGVKDVIRLMFDFTTRRQDSVVTFTKKRYMDPVTGEESIILTYVCASDAAGNVNTNPTGAGWDAAQFGEIQRLAVIPASGGSQPTNLFDLTIPTSTDSTIDLAKGYGANLVNNATTVKDLKDSYRVPLSGDIPIISIANMGDTKVCTVQLLIKRGL